jgi:hypothetical protein
VYLEIQMFVWVERHVNRKDMVVHVRIYLRRSKNVYLDEGKEED